MSTDSPQVIALPPVLYISGLAFGFILNLLMPLPFMPAALRMPVGLVLIGVAVVLMLYANHTFRKEGTNVNPRRPTLRIVSSGPFRFTRNPMYLSMALIVLGAAVWINSLWVLILLILTLFTIRFGVINREEVYLERKFGKEYLDYKSKVHRWF